MLAFLPFSTPGLVLGGTLASLALAGWLKNQTSLSQLHWNAPGVIDWKNTTPPEVGGEPQLSHVAIQALRREQPSIQDYSKLTGGNRYHVSSAVLNLPESSWINDIWGENRYIMSDYSRRNPLPYENPLPQLDQLAPAGFPGDGGTVTRAAGFKPAQRRQIVKMESMENTSIFQEDFMTKGPNHQTNQLRRALYQVPYPEKTDLRPHAICM